MSTIYYKIKRPLYHFDIKIFLYHLNLMTLEVYPLCFGENGSTEEIFLEIANAITHDVPRESIARGFIYAVADYILEIATIYSGRLGKEKQIVLSGGTFLNRILLERTIELLEADGFKVYISEQLPPGDGGICLGQAMASRLLERC